MASALDVARYLVHLASSEEEPDYLTPLAVQKLLYYVQGWALASFGQPLFAGRIEAWKLGPVIREVWLHFTQFGRNCLPPEEGREPVSLSPSQKAFVRSVWDAYKVHSPIGLKEMTHREAPWRDARGDLPPEALSDAEITHEAMRAFFETELKNCLVPGLSVKSAYRGVEQLERGEGRPHREVFARLRSPS
jgi:uncharacterized phage-associated protein